MTDLLPEVEGFVSCLTCGCGALNELEPDRHICVGFGSAWYSRDGEILWQEESAHEFEDCPTVAMVEELAKKDPDHDWRIYFEAPLYEAEYQRHGADTWVLVTSGRGFA